MTDRPRKLSVLTKIPRLAHPPIAPTGPRVLNVAEVYVGGYGNPPAGFVSGQTSVTEWILYHSLAKIFRDPVDPRVPPFYGGRDWSYQVPKGGKWTRAIGSAVVDFVVYYGVDTAIGIRLQTEFYHVFTDVRKQANDLMSRVNLSDDLIVVDMYDNELLGDPSGQKAIINTKRILGMIEHVNPIVAGNAQRASKLKTLNG